MAGTRRVVYDPLLGELLLNRAQDVIRRSNEVTISPTTSAVVASTEIGAKTSKWFVTTELSGQSKIKSFEILARQVGGSVTHNWVGEIGDDFNVDADVVYSGGAMDLVVINSDSYDVVAETITIF